MDGNNRTCGAGKTSIFKPSRNLMQAQKQTAISTALHPPKVGEPFIHDICSILKRAHL